MVFRAWKATTYVAFCTLWKTRSKWERFRLNELFLFLFKSTFLGAFPENRTLFIISFRVITKYRSFDIRKTKQKETEMTHTNKSDIMMIIDNSCVARDRTSQPLKIHLRQVMFPSWQLREICGFSWNLQIFCENRDVFSWSPY